MANAAESIARVKTFLEDPNGRFFTTDDYVRAYNSALDEISEATEINEGSVYVKRRKWSILTDLRGSLPSTALRVTSVFNPKTQQWLDPTSVRELDLSLGRHWERQFTQTRWWFMRGLWHLGAYPAAGDDISPLKVYYSALLPHVKATGGLVTGLQSTPDLPPDFSDVIEHYMMYELMAERKETEKSLEYFKRYLAAIPVLRNLGENRMRRDRIPKIGARR